MIFMAIGTLALLLLGFSVYFKKINNHEVKIQEEVKTTNVGETGGDYVPEGTLTVVGRGYLTMILGQLNTEILEEGLKNYFIEEKLSLESGQYRMVVKKNSVLPEDSSKPWTYKVPISVNGKYYFILHLEAAPNEELNWSIEKTTGQ